MRVRVEIVRRPEIADPQGETVRRALGDLGHEGIDSLRINRTVHLNVTGTDRDDVESRVDAMCRQLLTNPVLEDYVIEIVE